MRVRLGMRGWKRDVCEVGMMGIRVRGVMWLIFLFGADVRWRGRFITGVAGST